MGTLRRFTAGLLTLGLHFSLCTGGLLSVASAFATEVSREHLATADLMTPALADVSLCATMTPAPEQTEDEPTPQEPRGCDQGKACLTSANLEGRERSATLVGPQIFVPAIVSALHGRTEISGAPPGTTRDGPRHAEARLLASVLLKRE